MQIVNPEQLVGATMVESVEQQRAAVSKFLKSIESKSAQKALRAGGLTTMALTLAACGGGSDPAPTATTPVAPTTPTTPVVTPPVVTPPTVTPAAFTLTAGVDKFTGNADANLIDGRDQQGNVNAVQRLDQFDSIDGAGGRDTIIVSGNLADVDFTNVRNVEIVTTEGAAVTLGALARAAGIDTLNALAGGANNVNLVDFAGALTVTGGAGASTVTLNLATAGLKTLNLAGGQDVLTITPLAGAAAGSVQVNFTSAKVGDDAQNNVTIVNAAGNIVVNDEGTSIQSTTNTDVFNVVGLGADGAVDAAQNRGNFSRIELGTNGADNFGVANANVYYNVGQGNDTVTAGTGNDFIVGGDGNDFITTGGGKDTVLAGAGNDRVQESTGATALVNVNLGAGDDVIRFETNQFAATGAANTRDTVTGGDGFDTLWLGTFTAAPPAAGEAATVTGFEAIRTAGALNLKTADVQAGISTVVIDSSSSGTIEFEAGSSTVQVGAEALTVGTLNGNAGGFLNNSNMQIVAAGTGAGDKLALVNGRTTGTDSVFSTADAAVAGTTITATGYEAVTINTGAVATAAQSIGRLVINASSPATATSLTLTGANAALDRNSQFDASSNTTSVFSIDASGLAAQVGTAVTLGVVASGGGATSTVNVVGSAGNDVIRFGAGAGKASVDGGNGNDTINATDGNDTLVGGTGADSITALDGKDNISGGAGDDVVNMDIFLTSDDTVAGGEGRDTLAVDSAVTAAAQANVGGFEVLRLDTGLTQVMTNFVNNTTFDTVAVNADATFVIQDALASLANVRFDANLGAGQSVTFNPLVNTDANALAIAAGGAAGARAINSLVLTNVDALTINGRADGAVTDELAVLRLTANDINSIVVKSNQIVTVQDVSVGTDVRTITVDGSAAASFNFGFNNAGTAGGVGAVVANNVVNTATTATFQVTGSAGADRIGTGAGDDVINGGAGNDTIVSGAGRDVINGGDGADVITGGAGADTINGGAGNDTYNVNDVVAAGVADSLIAAFDVVTVTAGDTFNLATSVTAFRAAEVSIVGNAPTASADLLASLNTAFGANDDNNPNVEAILFQYADGRQFLVIDSDGAGGNGNGTIDGLDTIIELVGNVGTLALSGGDIIVS